MPDDPQEKAPGTLTGEEVKDELRRLKDNLLHVPAALGDIAKAAVGRIEPSPGQPAPATTVQPPATPAPGADSQPTATGASELVVLSRLAAMERRLESIERTLAEIKQAVEERAD